MKVAVASDHGGFRLKQEVVVLTGEIRHRVSGFRDFFRGTGGLSRPGPAGGRAVQRGDFDRGIICCGTGIGVAIAANKVPGIRAALCHDTFSARAAREHNDANVLTMGQRVIGPGLAGDIVAAWLQAEFQGGRHERRVAKICAIEKNTIVRAGKPRGPAAGRIFYEYKEASCRSGPGSFPGD